MSRCWWSSITWSNVQFISYSTCVELRNFSSNFVYFFSAVNYQSLLKLKWLFLVFDKILISKKIVTLVITLISWKLSKQSSTTISNFNMGRIWDEPGIKIISGTNLQLKKSKQSSTMISTFHTRRIWDELDIRTQ